MEPLSIDRHSTALVVIDLQKGIVGMPAEPHPAAEVIARASAMAQAFRAHQMPVFLVHVTPSADAKDFLTPNADVASPIKQGALPSGWAEIVPELGPMPGDFVITKRQWGAFHGTELDLQLRRREMKTIVLCGISTNIGVESTARFAYELGYQQIFVEDACAARSKPEHDAAIMLTFPRIGRVRKAADVLAALR